MHQALFGDFDIAQLALYLFWGFFFGLVIYLQRENAREGWPAEDERTGERRIQPIFGRPGKKVFKLPHGLGEKVIGEDGEPDTRTVNAEPLERFGGTAYEPKGDLMTSCVGPAAYAERPDRPDLDAEGRNKIVPMKILNDWSIADFYRDPRGYRVFSGDGQYVGELTDIWVDRGEQTPRYFEVALDEGGGTRLIPSNALILDRWSKTAHVEGLFAEQFAGIPTTASPEGITMLEEEKVMAYVNAGKLFAGERREPLI